MIGKRIKAITGRKSSTRRRRWFEARWWLEFTSEEGSIGGCQKFFRGEYSVGAVGGWMIVAACVFGGGFRRNLRFGCLWRLYPLMFCFFSSSLQKNHKNILSDFCYCLLLTWMAHDLELWICNGWVVVVTNALYSSVRRYIWVYGCQWAVLGGNMVMALYCSRWQWSENMLYVMLYSLFQKYNNF